MVRRASMFVWIVWQMFWLNAVIPGHTRGAITLPSGGDGASHCGAASCCDMGDSNKKAPATPTQEQRARCAVCYFAAGLATPDVFDIDLAPTRFCAHLQYAFGFVPRDSFMMLPYDACGPPIGAAVLASI